PPPRQQRAQCQRGGGGDDDVPAPAAARYTRAQAPSTPVDGAHERVVGVAGLAPHADPAISGSGGMSDRPPSGGKTPACRAHTKREIGVLAIRAGKTLV